MKLLTLNTHSLLEENYIEKKNTFVNVIMKLQPDIIALQEVNQEAVDLLAEENLLDGYFPNEGHSIPVRQSNHAAQVAFHLRQAGIPANWTWLPMKLGYGKYDEGLALISLKGKITHTDSFYISRKRDYNNWKTRMVLGIKIEGNRDWFYTVHMGWWNDEEESFAKQWTLLNEKLAGKKKEGRIWLMGDFNTPAENRNEGYDFILDSGWKDTWMMAQKKDRGVTVKGQIDGWKEQENKVSDEMRIDYIWCNENLQIDSSYTMFTGIGEPIVSDHFGVMIQYEKGE